MRIKSALVLTALSALAAWATCADATIRIANPVTQAYCLLNGKAYPIGDVETVPETILDKDGNQHVIYHTLTCTTGGWVE